MKSKLDELIDKFRENIMTEIKSHLNDLKAEYLEDPKFKQRGGSFIQASRTEKNYKKSFQKKKNDYENKSKISQRSSQRLSLENSRLPQNLFCIEEVPE